MGQSNWEKDWNVGVRVWVERGGEAVLGEGRAELLSAIEAEQSITRAAKTAGMSYRRAWNLIQATNAAAGAPLVVADVGGHRGGGARLTEQGRSALAVYEQLRRSITESSAAALRQAILPAKDDTGHIHLSAAISLQEAVGQILAEYTLEQPATRVRAIFGASNELADHLLAGAPCDMLISAEAGEIERLTRANLIVEDSQQIVARNGLAIIGTPNDTRLKKATDLLAAPFQRLAIADPECPLGRYSKTYLEKVGVYDRLLPKVLHVDNSRAVLAAVASGVAQVGVAFASDAAGNGNWSLLLRIPISQSSAEYVAAKVRANETREETDALFDFLSSPVARRCYRRCGLTPA